MDSEDGKQLLFDVTIGRDGQVRFASEDVGPFLSAWFGWEKDRRVEPPPSPTKLLTVEEFALAVGISRASAFRLMRDGLPSPLVPRVGRRVDLEQGRAWMVAKGLKVSAVRAKELRRGKGR